MSIEYNWSLEAKTIDTDEHTGVIDTVLFCCTATNGTATCKHRGSVVLPEPTSNFVPLSDILCSEDRKKMVIEWAERCRPGLVASTEAALANQLEARSETRSIKPI